MKRRQFLKGLLATGAVVLVKPELALPAKPMIIRPIADVTPAMDWYWQQVSGSVVLSGVESLAIPCEVVRSTEYGARYAQKHYQEKIGPLLQAKLENLQRTLHEHQLKLLYGDGNTKSYK